MRISDWSSDVCSSDLKAEALKAEVADLKATLPAKEEAERERLAALHDLLAALPNLPAADVPDGDDENGNVEIARWGTPRTFDVPPRAHPDPAPALGRSDEATYGPQARMRT